MVKEVLGLKSTSRCRSLVNAPGIWTTTLRKLCRVDFLVSTKVKWKVYAWSLKEILYKFKLPDLFFHAL